MHEILEPEGRCDRISRAVTQLLLWLIVANVAAFALDTVATVRARFGTALFAFEVFSVLVFTAEYLLRLWSCVEAPRWRPPLRGRVRWAFTPMALIDLAAVLPFWLPFVGVDLRFTRAARIARLLRIAKFGRYSRALRTLGRVLVRKRSELVSVAMVLAVLLVLTASLMYLVEHEAQPEKFSSGFAAMWWAIVTLTTVGYGDVFPATTIGQLLGAVIAVLGIGMFALPAGILGAAFTEELARRRAPVEPPADAFATQAGATTFQSRARTAAHKYGASEGAPPGVLFVRGVAGAGTVRLAATGREPVDDGDLPRVLVGLSVTLPGHTAQHLVRLDGDEVRRWHEALLRMQQRETGSAELHGADDELQLWVGTAPDDDVLHWEIASRHPVGSGTELRFALESPAAELPALVGVVAVWCADAADGA